MTMEVTAHPVKVIVAMIAHYKEIGTSSCSQDDIHSLLELEFDGYIGLNAVMQLVEEHCHLGVKSCHVILKMVGRIMYLRSAV